jgi:hypothetical protein
MKEYVSVDEVPPPHQRVSSPWDEIFGSIPLGKALVLKEGEVSSSTVRAALVRKHKQGKFKNIQFSSKGAHGNALIYLANTDKPKTPTKLEKAFS